LPATDTLTHEYGHHFALNHPHEGYDSEFNFYFSSFFSGFEFVWTGTETNSVMSYNLLNNDFGQWDHDNFNRFWAAGYIKAANAIAADIVASPHAAAAQPLLASADVQVGLAKDAVAQHNYLAAFDHALLAYVHVRAAADAAGVPVVGTEVGRQVPPGAPGNSGQAALPESPLRRTNGAPGNLPLIAGSWTSATAGIDYVHSKRVQMGGLGSDFDRWEFRHTDHPQGGGSMSAGQWRHHVVSRDSDADPGAYSVRRDAFFATLVDGGAIDLLTDLTDSDRTSEVAKARSKLPKIPARLSATIAEIAAAESDAPLPLGV
jgi:hypothetical protein